MASYIFDGSSSISLTKRPFFSIVVPCYNSRETLGALLESIVLQHMNDEIEIPENEEYPLQQENGLPLQITTTSLFQIP